MAQRAIPVTALASHDLTKIHVLDAKTIWLWIPQHYYENSAMKVNTWIQLQEPAENEMEVEKDTAPTKSLDSNAIATSS
jgi:hypothetical protein